MPSIFEVPLDLDLPVHVIPFHVSAHSATRVLEAMLENAGQT
jgi:hypothetical protein